MEKKLWIVCVMRISYLASNLIRVWSLYQDQTMNLGIQDNGLVPIVEPVILLDGYHPIERILEVAEKVWAEVLYYLAENNVVFERILLKTSMVTPGADHKENASAKTIAKYTLTVLKRRVPPVVPGIMFFSGGQSEV